MATTVAAALLGASTQQSIGIVIIVVAALTWLFYVIAENRKSAPDNLDSVLNAPNRKAPPSDEEFEGPRLDRFLLWGLVLMAIVAVGLPLYWLGEPGRMVGAVRGFDKRSVHRGEELFLSTKAKPHPGFGCADCHGDKGVGGVAAWNLPVLDDGGGTVKDAAGKDTLNSVQWAAPALDTIALRYREEQLRSVLIYGRGTNKPMPAWGVRGGGPMNAQQIDDLINYLKFLAIEENAEARRVYEATWEVNGNNADRAFEAAFVAARKEAQERSTKALEDQKKADADAVTRIEQLIADADARVAEAQKKVDDAKAKGDAKAVADAEKALGELKAAIESAPQDLEKAKTAAAKSDGQILFEQHCARCHTKGWSYGDPQTPGGGFYGPNLTGGSTKAQFPDEADHVEFVKNGVDDGRAYGTGGVNKYSGGGMPYFANQLTDEQIEAVVKYERSL